MTPDIERATEVSRRIARADALQECLRAIDALDPLDPNTADALAELEATLTQLLTEPLT